MSKKLILVLFVIVFLSLYRFARADVIIEKIMYDPPGVDLNIEWIKVQNVGATPVDLSLWYVADYDTSWHFHKIIGENVTVLNPSAEALIVSTSQANFADFKTKMPNYSGLLFRASFTLGNDKGRLGMSPDKKNILSDTAYVAPAPVVPAPKIPAKIVSVKTSKTLARTVLAQNSPLPEYPKGEVENSSTPSLRATPEEGNNFPMIILIPFLGVTAGAVYFIRRKKVLPESGNDFEILDE